MSKHTPTPYEDTGNSEVIKIQDAINLQTVAFLKPGYPHNKANAEFIVNACNNHDRLEANNKELKECMATNLHDLTEAYNTIDKLIEALKKVRLGICCFCKHFDKTFGCDNSKICKLISDIEQALDKAKGEHS